MYFAPPTMLVDVTSIVKAPPESLKEVSVDRRTDSWCSCFLRKLKFWSDMQQSCNLSCNGNVMKLAVLSCQHTSGSRTILYKCRFINDYYQREHSSWQNRNTDHLLPSLLPSPQNNNDTIISLFGFSPIFWSHVSCYIATWAVLSGSECNI